MGLGLLTLVFLLAMTAYYLDRGLSQKPEWLSKVAAYVGTNLSSVTMWGVIYSLLAIVLSPLAVWRPFALLMVILGNLGIFLMTLPYVLEHALAKYPDKIPAPLVTELRNAVGFVQRREQLTGYVGVALSFLLFVALFR